MTSAGSRNRRWALAAYALATLFAFPHELPGGGVLDLGIGLAWLAPAALVIGLEGLSPRRAALAAFVASLAGHVVLFHWFMVVTIQYGGMPWGLGLLSPLVPAYWVSQFSALFAWLWARWARQAAFPVLAGAAAWVAVDWLRGRLFGGFPWATLGYALHLDLPLLAWTRWGGVYVLSFFAVAAGIALARACVSRGGVDRHALGAVGVGLALVHGLGALMMHEDPASARPIRIAAIQGNIDQGEKWDAERRSRILDTYLRLSGQAGEAGAELIVWPETAVPGLIENDPGLRDQLALLARRHRVPLVLGGMGVEIDHEARRFSAFFDSAFVIDATGEVRDRYDKTQLVPFGEFVPLRAFLGRFFQSLATGLSNNDVTPGPAPRALSVELGDGSGAPLRVGVPICYELLFPHLVRQFAADGAGVLLAVTNDAWYGRTGAPHQFLAMTAMRSAESGLWTVRAANTGVSALIDGRGGVRERSELFEEASVIGEVPVATAGAETFYARFGDVFAWVCVLGVFGSLARRVFRDWRASRAARARLAEASADAPE